MDLHKIGICQLELNLSNFPHKIMNISEHRNKVKRSLEYFKQEGVDYAIFPEYSYCAELRNLYTEYSTSMVIIGGSFISDDSYNKTVIAFAGNFQYYSKIEISPYQYSSFEEDRLNRGDEYFYYKDSNTGKNIAVLTCYDYYKLGRKFIEFRAEEGEMIDIIFSPSSNNNPAVFHEEAQCLHNHRTFYSVICNVCLLRIEGVRRFDAGGSSIFGPHDSTSRERIISRNLCLANYSNMILNLPEGERMAIVSLHIPYIGYKRRSDEFVNNPVDIKVENI